MGNPIFRFTLRHAEAGNLEITEPDGWMDAKLKLERHEDFSSLVEYFEGAFIFYGTNGVDNGGIDFIRHVEQNYGADATINIEIEVSFDSGRNYEFIFIGQLDLTTINELKDNRAQIAIIRDDFWAKFISRKDTPVNLQATTDLDEEVITPISTVRLNLPSQKIRYNGEYEYGDTFTYYEETDAFGDSMFGLQLDWDIIIEDDLKKFTIPKAGFQLGNVSGVVTAGSLIGNFEAPFDGDYTFDIKLYASEYFPGTNSWVANSSLLNFFILKTTETAQTPLNVFAKSDITCGSDTIAAYTFQGTMRLFRGEQIKVYGRKTAFSHNYTVFGNTQLTWHSAVVASTGPLVLSGEQTIDGVLTSADIVLVKNNSDPAENGLWLTGAGAWTRSPGADSASELNIAAVYITAGDSNINTNWKQDNTINTVNVDPQSWVYIIASDEKFKLFPFCFTMDNHFIVTADTTFRNSQARGKIGRASCRERV